MADGPDVDEDSSALLSGADNVQGGESSSRLEGGKTRAKSSPMFFKDFPKPTSFTFRSSDKTPSASSSTHIFPPFVSNRTPSANRIRDQRTVTTPDGQVLAFSPQPERNEEEMRAIRTPSISDAGADAFLQVFGGSTYSPPPIPDDFSPPLNLAATGIVRLGSASSSSGSASAYRGSNRASGSERSSGRQGDESGAASDDPNSGPRSASFSETSSVDVQLREPDQNLYTVRHERIVTDDGHHLVLGHDGKFVKCEDEVSNVSRSFRLLTHTKRFLLTANSYSRSCPGLWSAYCLGGRRRYRLFTASPGLRGTPEVRGHRVVSTI
jgi:hypothetical protein